jgi:hypothetical protein
VPQLSYPAVPVLLRLYLVAQRNSYEDCMSKLGLAKIVGAVDPFGIKKDKKPKSRKKRAASEKNEAAGLRHLKPALRNKQSMDFTGTDSILG